MQTNKTKAKLKAGEAVFGCFVRFPDPGLAELIAYQGWDFMIFDAEHGTVEPRDCENMVRAAELHGVTPLVRVTTNFQPVILRYLDTGAQGLHVPWVNSAEDAELAVRSVKFHPRGNRGLASSRAADYGQRAPFGQYVEKANAETMVVVQVESGEAANQASAIAAVEGVDVVFVGPTDLSNSLGFPGEPQAPAVQSAIQAIQHSVVGSNAALGIFVSNPQSAREWRDRGARYFAITADIFLRTGSRDFLAAARA